MRIITGHQKTLIPRNAIARIIWSKFPSFVNSFRYLFVDASLGVANSSSLAVIHPSISPGTEWNIEEHGKNPIGREESNGLYMFGALWNGRERDWRESDL